MQTAHRAEDLRANDLRAAGHLNAAHGDIRAAHDDIHATHADASDAALGARLNRLAATLDEAERCARIFRTPREEFEARLMRRPLTTERAFARFGLLLGTLPPVAIFGRILTGAQAGERTLSVLAFILPMLALCAFFGRLTGKRLGRRFDEAERGSWLKTMLVALAYAFVWAVTTGTVGGSPVFVGGGVFGFACALPCALVAFSVFAPLHRLLARGGMIDARHFQPLAWGINLTLAALILSPHIIPY